MAGQFVTLQLETGTSADATVLPAHAIQQGLEGAFVYRVHDAIAEPIQVVTSYLDDEIAVIATGVVPGDLIVIDGQSRLQAGRQGEAIVDASGKENVAGT